MEPVFAEYEPVELERAFKVKNRLDDAPAVISTKGRKKEYPEMDQKQNLSSLIVANFVNKTILGLDKNKQSKGLADIGLQRSSLHKLNGLVEGYTVIDIKQNLEVIFNHGR